MLKFLSAFVPQIDAKPLVWDGTSSLRKRAVDTDAAYEWYRATERFVDWESYELFLFGDKRIKTVPILKAELAHECEITDASKEANEVIRTLSKGGLVSDEFFQLLARVFDSYRIVRVSNKGKPFHCFERITNDSAAFRGAVEIRVGEDKVADVDVHLSIPSLEPEEFRYRNVMLLIKEVQDGYVSFREHSLVNPSGDELFEQKYKIGQDITVKILNKRVVSVDAKETAHAITKEGGSWLIDKEFPTETYKYVDYSRDDDGTETYVIKGAYTHILRKVLGFDPQTWQYRFLISNKRLSAVAGVRRGGKTILSSYLILRELYRNPSTRKHAMRQRKVLYLAPSEDKFKAVLDYLEASSEKIRILKVLKYYSVEKRYKLVDESLGRNRKKVVTTVATCDFASGKGYEPGRGNGSDFVIIDEAGYVSKDVYLTLLPIIENENANMFCVSTIDWETPKQWFYEMLLDYEQGNDPEGYAQRVTIDDIDDTIISQASKDRMKSALKDNPNRFYAELYATFPNIATVFDTPAFFVSSPPPKDVLSYVIGYDPAKRSDFAGIIVGEVLASGKMRICMEDKLQGDYSAQRDYLLSLKRRYEEKGYQCPVIIDATMVGDVVADTFGNLIDYKVWYSSGTRSPRPELDKWGTWKYSKRDLVHTAQAMMQERMVYADGSLTQLMAEMKNFKAYQTPAGNTKYEAVSGHDDLVNAMMLTCFYYGHLSGQFHRIAYDADKTLRLVRASGAEAQNLYDPYQKRSATVYAEAPKKKYTF